MVSIYDWFGYEVPIRERYKLIKEAGFEAVLLWWSDGFGRGAGYREGVKLARSAGLLIENIHTPVQQQNDLSLNNLTGESLLDCYMQCTKIVLILIYPLWWCICQVINIHLMS